MAATYQRGAGLLFPAEEHPYEDQATELHGSLGPNAEQDLELRSIAKAIAGTRHDPQVVLELLTRPLRDPRVLEHRYSLLRTLHHDSSLRAKLEHILPQLAELSVFRRAAAGNESQVLQTIWRLGELELYVHAVQQLHDILKSYLETDNTIGRVAGRVASLHQDPLFDELRRELPELQEAIRKRRSITVGINLDERLRPTEAALLSVNAEQISDRSLLGGFLSRFLGSRGAARSPSLRSHGKLHYARLPREFGGSEGRPPLTPLFRELETLLEHTTRPVQHALERYLRLETGWLAGLREELGPFCGAASLMHELQTAGLPVCLPTLLPARERHFSADALYNLRLALQTVIERSDASVKRTVSSQKTESEDQTLKDPIVTNPARFDAEARAFILTGPNHGGKTTYTQSIGMAFAMAQAGLFVPARSAQLSPADRIETHFPAPEAPELDGGRLGEEAARLSELFDTITGESLVLLNESLASTGAGEATYLAEDLIRGLCMLGCRTVFATHLHDLAARIQEINATVESDTQLASLVATGRMHAEPFTVMRSAPVGRSFAREIAQQHGISLEAISDRLKRRGLP